jgi:hypothetical protein
LFERYSRKLRQVIFFARYEALNIHSHWIEPEHFLLGAIREDKELRSQFETGGLDVLRAQISAASLREHVSSPSTDLAMSNAAQQILARTVEEADRLRETTVEPRHLIVALLREPATFACRLLEENGFDYEGYRDKAARPRLPPFGSALLIDDVPTLRPAIDRLADLIQRGSRELSPDKEPPLSRTDPWSWTRKETLGYLAHLSSHFQTALGYVLRGHAEMPLFPEPESTDVACFARMPWPHLILAWVSSSELNMHVLASFRPERVEECCEEADTPFLVCLDRYLRLTESGLDGLLATA